MSSTKRNRSRSVDRANDKEEAAPGNKIHRENFIKLTSLNPYITCPLCNGYFIEATTVIDCLHTFCKSCLLKYFEENNDCPKCHYQIHQSHPSHYVAFDRTMQDIVYKLVPGMQTEEQRRREQFKKRQQSKGLKESNSKAQQQSVDCDGSNMSDSLLSSSFVPSDDNSVDAADVSNTCSSMECCSADQDPTTTHRRRDESVLIQLIPDAQLDSMTRSFVRLSAFATVNTVKRLLAYLLLSDITKYGDFDIFCNNELMGRDFSMAFISKTRWRNKAEPLQLMYKEHLEF